MDPSCLAIVLCDYVIEDKATNNKSLIGLFNRIHAAKFPCSHPRMVIYVSITDGRGNTALEVFLERARDRREVFKAHGQVEFREPNHVIDLVFDLRGVVFEESGAYFVGIRTSAGKVLGERKFHVAGAKDPDPAEGGFTPSGPANGEPPAGDEGHPKT
jgi:hypothetical protein